jgi:hypothetical protein
MFIGFAPFMGFHRFLDGSQHLADDGRNGGAELFLVGQRLQRREGFERVVVNVFVGVRVQPHQGRVHGARFKRGLQPAVHIIGRGMLFYKFREVGGEFPLPEQRGMLAFEPPELRPVSPPFAPCVGYVEDVLDGAAGRQQDNAFRAALYAAVVVAVPLVVCRDAPRVRPLGADKDLVFERVRPVSEGGGIEIARPSAVAGRLPLDQRVAKLPVVPVFLFNTHSMVSPCLLVWFA